jgi:hypothetical protein
VAILCLFTALRTDFRMALLVFLEIFFMAQAVSQHAGAGAVYPRGTATLHAGAALTREIPPRTKPLSWTRNHIQKKPLCTRVTVSACLMLLLYGADNCNPTLNKGRRKEPRRPQRRIRHARPRRKSAGGELQIACTRVAIPEQPVGPQPYQRALRRCRNCLRNSSSPRRASSLTDEL